MTHLLNLIYLFLLLLAPTSLSYWVTQKAESELPCKPSTSRSLLTFLCCWCAIQICIALILGLLGLYRVEAVIATHVILLISTYSLNNGTKRSPLLTAYQQTTNSLPTSTYERTHLVFFITFFLAIFWKNISTPITEYDSLTYHLPNMVTWIQNANFTMLDNVILSLVNRYPYNWQAFTGFLLLPYGNDTLATLPNIIALLILWLSVYAISQQFRAKKIFSLLAASSATTLPLQIVLVNSTMVDIAFSAFFMATLHYGILFYRFKYLPHLALFFISAGIFIGIKMNGPILFILLITLFCIIFSGEIIKPHSLSRIFHHQLFKYHGRSRITFWNGHLLKKKYVVLVSLLFLLLSSFWYLRNWIQLGNPLGVIPITLGNTPLFPGLEDFSPSFLRSTSLANTFNLSEIKHWQILLNQIFLRLGFPFFCILSLVPPTIIYFLKPSEKVNKRLLYYLTVLSLCCFYLYWKSPYTGTLPPSIVELHPWIGWNFRYLYHAISLLAIIGALGATAVNLPATIAVIIFIINYGFATYQLHIPTYQLVIIIILALIIIIFCHNLQKSLRFQRQKAHLFSFPKLIPCTIFALTAIILGYSSQITRTKKWNTAYLNAPQVLDSHLNYGENIGFLSTFRIYSYYGNRFKRKVIDIREKASTYENWLLFLDQNNIGCIAFEPSIPSEAIEISWLSMPKTPYTTKINLYSGISKKEDRILFCRK